MFPYLLLDPQTWCSQYSEAVPAAEESRTPRSLHGEDAVVICLSPRKNHGTWWQSLFATKPFTGLRIAANVIGIFLGRLALPPNPVKVVLFLLLFVCNLARKMVVGVGAQLAQICADFADVIGSSQLQLLNDIE